MDKTQRRHKSSIKKKQSRKRNFEKLPKKSRKEQPKKKKNPHQYKVEHDLGEDNQGEDVQGEVNEHDQDEDDLGEDYQVEDVQGEVNEHGQDEDDQDELDQDEDDQDELDQDEDDLGEDAQLARKLHLVIEEHIKGDKTLSEDVEVVPQKQLEDEEKIVKLDSKAQKPLKRRWLVVFVANVPRQATAPDLTKYLQKHFGEIGRVRMIIDNETGQSRGMCFVQVNYVSTYRRLLFNSHLIFMGRTLIIKATAGGGGTGMRRMDLIKERNEKNLKLINKMKQQKKKF